MTIRKAAGNDYERLKELKLLAKKEESKYSGLLKPLSGARRCYLNYLKADLTKRNSGIFIALEDDEIVGMVVVKILKALPVSKYDKKGYISNLYVREPFRNRGVGKKLVQRAMAWLRSKDVPNVFLEIHAKNLSAQGLYRKLGFKDYSVKMVKAL